MEFSSTRQWYFQHFISKNLHCVVASFLEDILMIFNILVISRQVFLKVNNFHIFPLQTNFKLAAVSLMCYFGQWGVIIFKVSDSFFLFVVLCKRLKIRNSALVSQSVLSGRLLPTVTTAHRQNRKPTHNENVCPPFNNYYFLSFYILNGAEESFFL